jgi:hypothetical protein
MRNNIMEIIFHQIHFTVLAASSTSTLKFLVPVARAAARVR